MAGKWKSYNINKVDETAKLEFEFKNDSVVTLTIFAEEHNYAKSPVNFHECTLSLDGTYKTEGPYLNFSWNMNSVREEDCKFTLAEAEKKHEAAIERLLFQFVEDTLQVLDPHAVWFRSYYHTQYGMARILFHKQIEYPKRDLTQQTDYSKFDIFELTLNKYRLLGIWVVLLILLLIISLIKYADSSKIKHSSAEQQAKSADTWARFTNKYLTRSYTSLQFFSFAWEFMLLAGIFLLLTYFYNDFTIMVSIFLAILAFKILKFNFSIDKPSKRLTMEIFKREKVNRDYVLLLDGFSDGSNSIPESLNDLTKRIRIHCPMNYEWSWEWFYSKFIDENILTEAWSDLFPVYRLNFTGDDAVNKKTTTIYLDKEGDSWKENILFLMEHAKYIIIPIVSMNQDLLWQIKKCNALYPEKTVYYVDYVEKLPLLKEQLGDSLPKPLEDYYNQHPLPPEGIEKLIQEVEVTDPVTLRPIIINRFAFEYEGKSRSYRYYNSFTGILDTAKSVINGTEYRTFTQDFVDTNPEDNQDETSEDS